MRTSRRTSAGSLCVIATTRSRAISSTSSTVSAWVVPTPGTSITQWSPSQIAVAVYPVICPSRVKTLIMAQPLPLRPVPTRCLARGLFVPGGTGGHAGGRGGLCFLRRSAVTTAVDAWPFTGRDGELQVALDAVARRGCLVIAGAPGVGKSRLARELLARVAGGGHGFVAATASSRAIPLGALAGWTGTDPDAEADVTAVQRAVRALRAGGPGWALGIDDAHQLDEVSATVLQH